MVDPHTLIAIFPSSDINGYLKGKKCINVYVDLKNVMIALFVKDVSDSIIYNTEKSGTIDSSIFQSCVYYASVWKKYAKRNGLDCKVFFCTDIGKSVYHRAIHGGYKANRDVTSTTMTGGLMDNRLKVIRDKNFTICQKIINKIPNVHFISLDYLESDFLCHYLITRKFKDQEGVLHVICSGDKDLTQTLVENNVLMTYKRSGNKYILNEASALYNFVKLDKLSPEKRNQKIRELDEIAPKHIPAIMAMIGDVSDDIPGVQGIGQMTAVTMMAESHVVDKYIGTPEELLERVNTGGKFFKIERDVKDKLSKHWVKVMEYNDLVTKAYKLISFDALINWLESPDDVNKINWLNQINNVVEKKDIEEIDSLDLLYEGMLKLKDLKLKKIELASLYE